MQTKISVGREDSGKSIRVGVGDILEVSLPESDPGASWQVEVDAEVLAAVSSPGSTEAVWVLDDVNQAHQRTFRAARAGHTILTMNYRSVETGLPLDAFTLEVAVGDAVKPKPIRQPLPAPQLVVILFEFLLVALAGALVSFRFTVVVAAHTPHQTADLLLGLLGVVGMATVAGFLLVRIIGFFVSRMR